MSKNTRITIKDCMFFKSKNTNDVGIGIISWALVTIITAFIVSIYLILQINEIV